MTDRHDLILYGLAGLICLFGAYATSVIGQQANASRDLRRRMRWMVLGSLAASSAIWGDSFIALQMSLGGVPAGFAPVPMAASFVVTFGMVSAAAYITLTGRSRAVQSLGGGLAGLAISSAYFIGACALQVRGTIVWEDGRTVASVGLGLLLALLSQGVWLRSRSRAPMLAIVAFAAAICGAHFVATSAVTMTFDPRATLSQSLIDDEGLKRIVGLIVVVVMACTLLAQSMNRKSRRRREADRQQLRQLAEVAVEGLAICEGSRIVWINRSLEGLLPGVRASRIGGPIESLLAIESLASLPHDRECDTETASRSGRPVYPGAGPSSARS